MNNTAADDRVTPELLVERAAQLEFLAERYKAIALQLQEHKVPQLNTGGIKTADRGIGYLRGWLRSMATALEGELEKLALERVSQEHAAASERLAETKAAYINEALAKTPPAHAKEPNNHRDDSRSHSG